MSFSDVVNQLVQQNASQRFVQSQDDLRNTQSPGTSGNVIRVRQRWLTLNNADGYPTHAFNVGGYSLHYRRAGSSAKGRVDVILNNNGVDSRVYSMMPGETLVGKFDSFTFIPQLMGLPNFRVNANYPDIDGVSEFLVGQTEDFRFRDDNSDAQGLPYRIYESEAQTGIQAAAPTLITDGSDTMGFRRLMFSGQFSANVEATITPWIWMNSVADGTWVPLPQYEFVIPANTIADVNRVFFFELPFGFDATEDVPLQSTRIIFTSAQVTATLQIYGLG